MNRNAYGILMAAVLTGLCASGCGAQDGVQNGTQEQPAQAEEHKTETDTDTEDSVIVVMGPTSEPESGFDPAYGCARAADPEHADGDEAGSFHRL